jgi:hypothetical protein
VIDLDAPIVPGESAGGIAIGSRIEQVLNATGDCLHLDSQVADRGRPVPDWLARYMPPSLFSTVYRSAAIDLWVKDGVVHQVGVHDGYRGKLLSAVGIGSTLLDIKAYIGAWTENDEDALVLVDFPGICFDIDAVLRGTLEASITDLRHTPISRIFVYAPQR